MRTLPTLLAGIVLGVLPGSLAAAPAATPAAESREFLVHIGTYTGDKSKGIYLCRFEAGSGRLTAPELAAVAENPTFLAVHPAGSALYAAERPLLVAANEVRDGMVSAYRVDRRTGQLTLLNRESSRGNGPCHLSVDRSGRWVLVANYGSGSIAALPVGQDGRLGQATAFVQHTGSGANPQRQAGPHAHWIEADPANRFVLVCDLGLDQVLVYRWDAAQGALTPHEPAFAPLPPGSGPRHLAFHPNGRLAYVINELANTSTVFAYEAERGTLKAVQSVSTLPPDFAGRNTTAEIQVHPSGRFLYGSNRGHHSLAVFAIEAATGRLSLVEHQPTLGRNPRHFAVDPTGRWLLAANQDSDNVVVFALDPQSGRLKPTGQTIEVGKPVCLTFVPVER